jgi:hypothetical protein
MFVTRRSKNSLFVVFDSLFSHFRRRGKNKNLTALKCKVMKGTLEEINTIIYNIEHIQIENLQALKIYGCVNSP